MDRRRAAGLLLALAACIATATAAPTASNHTALDLYDGSPDGCYYNFQHYGEGDRIMTNEPCLNCTCHNRMLMCYLRVCPFTKPIGQDCTIEKRADQCCPIVTCPDVPVDLLTSTTTSPAEYGPTGVGKLDRFGCSINGKYFSEGSKVPPTPNKPCEHCYCIRNMTTCVMQECTLHVDGCTPIYHKDVCCPVRYSCDHPEDEMPLLDDLSTTVRPTQGFLLTTTTISPVTQISQDCVYDNRVFPDGALIKTEKACDHCYCMKGDIVCVVQECGTPMENEGKNCTALSPREGVCCPDTYICEGDESTTGTYDPYDFTTHAVQKELTTLSPPRRTSSEGSGYRNEPDDVPYTELPPFDHEIEGSGEEEDAKKPVENIPDIIPTTEITDDILASTEETHEYIPLTTTKPSDDEKPTTEVSKEDESIVDVEKTSESEPNLPSTTSAHGIKEEEEEPITDKILVEDSGSGEIPDDITLKPHKEVPMTTSLPDIDENIATTEHDILASRVTSEPEVPITYVPIYEEKTNTPIVQDIITSDIEKTTSKLPTEPAFTSAPASEESSIKSTDAYELATTITPIMDDQVKETTESPEQHIVTKVPDEVNREDHLDHQHYSPSTSTLGLDDEFVTTESQEHESSTERVKEAEHFEPQHHITTSTPMLEEIEKDTTEYIEPELVVSSGTTEDDTFNILSSTTSNVPFAVEDGTESSIVEEHNIPDDYIPGTTNIPDDQQKITAKPHEIPEIPIDTDIKESSEPEQYSSTTSAPALDESGRRTTQPDLIITHSEDDSKPHDFSSSATESTLEIEGTTAEPDKGLNTIPIEEDVPVSPEVQKTTIAEEKITTESYSDITFNSNTESATIPSKQITSDSSTSGELTTETTVRKEDYSPTESQFSPDLITVTAGITKAVISTLTPDHSLSTESALDQQQEIGTTLEPKYTEITLTKESTTVQPYDESSTSKVTDSEKDFTYEEDYITSAPHHEKQPETTTANQEDNEIFNEPRIPGEGDCLLNGVTYTNESAVPSTNKCQSGCKCVSSIIKCDSIICSPPPEYMNNCETMYDSPDACCPTYICDHKTETMPPQSHSQMSGTEASVIPSVHCHGDECEIEDKKHDEPSSDACISGNCAGTSDESKETSSYPPPSENIPKQPITDQEEGCVGDKCVPVLCTDENGCQVSPVIPCEGEKCQTDVITIQEPPQCADGENCAVPNIPSKDCSVENCGTIDTQLDDKYPKETCTDKEGCQKIPDTSEEECKDENCIKKDISSLDQQVPEQCTGLDCEKIPTVIQTSTPSVLEHTLQEDLSDKKEATVKVEEQTEKFETSTDIFQYIHGYETSQHPELPEITTKQPHIVSDDSSLTTRSDNTDLVTKFESDLEATTKSTGFTQQEATSDEYVPEKKKPESTEEPQYPLLVSTEPAIEEDEAKVTTSDKIAIDVSVMPGDISIQTDHPQQAVTMETTKPEIISPEETSTKISQADSTESSNAYTLETQDITESAEKPKPTEATKVVTDESFTEQPITSTLQPLEITKPSDDEQDETTKIILEESSTEPDKIQEVSKLPEVLEHRDTTIISEQESSTEPSKTYVTEPQETTITPIEIDQKETTEPPKSSEDSKDNTIETTEETRTEPTKRADIDEQTGEVDTTLKPSEDGGTETIVDDSQSVTVTPESIDQDKTTMKIPEEISSKPIKPTSTELPEVTQSPKEKDTTLIITEETDTEPSKSYITESPEITKPSDDQKVTTSKTLEEPSTEPSIPYTMEPHDITKSSEDLDNEDTITKGADESSTVPPQSYSTESEVTVKSEETTKTVLEDISTEPALIYVTEPKSPGEVYHENTTPEVSEESSSEPSKINAIEEPEITKSPEVIDHEITTTSVSEEYFTEPPKTVVTEPQKTQGSPDEVNENDTTPKISEEPGTEPSKLYSTETPEITKSSEDIDHERTTMVILEESTTKQPKPLEEKLPEVSKSPEEADQEDIISKITQTPTTESPIIYATEAQDVSKSPEEIESIGTTLKEAYERATEPSKTPEHHTEVDSESPEQYTTESNIETETLKPTIEMLTEKPKQDTEKPSMGSETLEIITTGHEFMTPESVELTTPSLISYSKITTPEETKLDETTDEAVIDTESQPTHGDTEGVTEISIKEQVSTTPAEKDISITEIPITSDQQHVEIKPEQHETKKPDLETQTISSSAVGQQEVTQPETLSTQQPEKSTDAEKEVPEPIDSEKEDELKTTSSEIQDQTTSKPIHSTQQFDNIETKTDHPEISYTPQAEHHTENILTTLPEVATEETFLGTNEPAITEYEPVVTEYEPAVTEYKPAVTEEETKTEKPVVVPEPGFTKETESETEKTQIVTDGKPSTQDEYLTEEPVSKYSSPEPTAGYDSTKSYPGEDVNTVEPTYQETKKPGKPVDDLIQSLVTEPSDLGTDSQTQTPIQVSSVIPEKDITEVSEADNVNERLTTPSGKLPKPTISELDDKSESTPSTEYEKTVDVVVNTESPATVDKTASETTTQKELLSEEATSQAPTAPEQNDILTSTIADGKITIKPSFEEATEAIAPGTSFTETQEAAMTDKPSTDVHKLHTESQYTTEASETKVTVIEDQSTQISGHDHTKLQQEVTTAPEIQIMEQTEQSMPAKSTESPSGTEPPISEPVSGYQDSVSVDQIITEAPTPTRKQSEMTTLELTINTESSTAFEPTTAPKHDTTSYVSEDSKQTEKIKEEDSATSPGVEFTTESAKITESSNAPEDYTQKQPQTVTPEKESSEDDLITKTPLEPEVYQTTISIIEDIPKTSTSLPVVSEAGSMTSVHDVPTEHTSPTQEQSTPVVTSDVETIVTTEESIAVQTERVTPASEKPLQETTAPEEEFILATAKATTVGAEVELTTSSPTPDKTARPTDGPAELPITTILDDAAKPVLEDFDTTASEAPVTKKPETFAPEAPITAEPEVSVTVEPAVPVTTAFESAITLASEAPMTAEPAAPITSAPEVSITQAPEAHITPEPEAPVTSTPEASLTQASEAPITTEPEAAITSAHEASITQASEAPITAEPEVPISTTPEAPITKAPEASITTAPEVPITTAPELPKPVSTEVASTAEVPTPDEEGSFPPSGGYGQEPDYVEEDQTFGPGTCRYGGKVYVSAQQIPRDDPCDFCFCFRSDIICLQQSCPPPIHGCHEEPIQGFCCPRYECPVSMATTVNVTTTTTTTTTTLPPHFPTHSYKGSAQKRGCQIKGQTYKVGEVVRASSGPCLHCTCGGDGQMKCDPKVCTPEPMLRQMIAAAVSAKRRR